jgi:hypothetical protein
VDFVYFPTTRRSGFTWCTWHDTAHSTPLDHCEFVCTPWRHVLSQKTCNRANLHTKGDRRSCTFCGCFPCCLLEDQWAFAFVVPQLSVWQVAGRVFLSCCERLVEGAPNKQKQMWTCRLHPSVNCCSTSSNTQPPSCWVVEAAVPSPVRKSGCMGWLRKVASTAHAPESCKAGLVHGLFRS